ncbi:MAG: hypothetical protein HOE61_02160 [Candidatus Marinimicrobia bacterium]|nr:hypothetical protein [Candidatus Neomarinimicrobiota bacterium]
MDSWAGGGVMIRHHTIGPDLTPGYKENPTVDEIKDLRDQIIRGMGRSSAKGEMRARRIEWLAHIAIELMSAQPVNEAKTEVVAAGPTVVESEVANANHADYQISIEHDDEHRRFGNPPKLKKNAMRRDVVEMAEGMHAFRAAGYKVSAAVSKLRGLAAGDAVSKVITDAFNKLQWDKRLEDIVYAFDPNYSGFPLQNNADLERFKEGGE